MRDEGRYQTWLAAHLGVTRGQVCNIVNGRRLVDRSRAARIAALLGWPMTELFERADSARQRRRPRETA